MLHADDVTGLFDLLARGNASLPPLEPPCFHQRAGGDVKGSRSFSRKTMAIRQEFEQSLLDDKGLFIAQDIEATNLAVVAIDGQLRFNGVDPIEDSTGRFAIKRPFGKLNFEEAFHRFPAETYDGSRLMFSL